MNWLTKGETANTHGAPGTVPVARIGGILRTGFGWSATSFPVALGGLTLLLTPQHVLDGAGSSSLLAVANEHLLNEEPHAIDLDAWVRSDELDLAAVKVGPSSILDRWKTVWPACSHTADLSVVNPAERLSVHVTSMPRPLPGAVTQRHPIRSGVEDHVRPLDVPGEFVLPCFSDEGASGSPVFLSDGPQFGFAGLVTSAAVDHGTGKIEGTVVLSSVAIERFLVDTFGG